MIKLVKSAVFLIVFAGFILTTNAQDSLQRVGVPKWQLSRLLDETKLYRLCDSTLTKYIKALDVSEKLNANNDSIKKELEFSRDAWKFTSLTKDTLMSNQSALQKVEIKTAEKKGLKKGVKISLGVYILIEVAKAIIRR